MKMDSPTSLTLISLVTFQISNIFCYSLLPTIRNPAGNNDPLTIELQLVCDKLCMNGIILQGYDPVNFFLSVTEQVSKNFAQLNISVALVDLEIWNVAEPDWSASLVTYDNALSNFETYRDHVLLSKAWSDVSVFITGRSLLAGTSGDAVGEMMIGGICYRQYGAGVVYYDSQQATDASLAATLTHELGHSLGFVHDTPGCCSIGDGNCLMAALTTMSQSVTPTFSSCSIAQSGTFRTSPQSGCLNSPGRSLMSQALSTCGNGMLEPGEGCDCGPVCLGSCCDCCDRDSCTLKSGATCVEGPCCETASCQFLSAGTVCREGSDIICDPSDYCTGTSKDCSTAVSPDGVDCQDTFNEAGFCVHGVCWTRSAECVQLFGEGYKNGADSCYKASVTRPNSFSNCGTISVGPGVVTYQRCSVGSDDNYFYKCGKLQCSNLIVPKQSKADVKGNLVPNPSLTHTQCLSGTYPNWLKQTPGGDAMVADGIKCGANRACLANACVSLTDVLASINVASDATSTGSSTCGDGITEGAEQCDCGIYQCDCCDQNTCQFIPSGTVCLTDTGCAACNGSSSSCSSMTVDDLTPCDGNNGFCLGGACSSLNLACQRYFGTNAGSATAFAYNKNLNTASSNQNAGGFVLRDVATNAFSPTKEFVSAESDGTCGMLLCISDTSDFVQTPTANGQSVTAIPYTADSNTFGYYSFETVRIRQHVYQRFFPILVDHGTPCSIGAEKAICTTRNLKMDAKGTNWYYYAKCISLTDYLQG